MAKGAIEPTWKLEHALIFGVYIAPIYPKAATLILKQHSTQTKQIAVLLEAEALFTLITTDVIRELRSSALLEITVWWYQYVLVAIWFIMGGKPQTKGKSLNCQTNLGNKPFRLTVRTLAESTGTI